MKVPPKRKGNRVEFDLNPDALALNESPSEKEGKFRCADVLPAVRHPSMKVPPKRKGNLFWKMEKLFCLNPSMKVPPKRKGNANCSRRSATFCSKPSMKVPPKRKGNAAPIPSMKVPPKRKGNRVEFDLNPDALALNESPSEKEGKFRCADVLPAVRHPSMKVPPKRKGNLFWKMEKLFCLNPSMKVPPKRKGNANCSRRSATFCSKPSMKVPPKRKGNAAPRLAHGGIRPPSMKVPPKRKGNAGYPRGR